MTSREMSKAFARLDQLDVKERGTLENLLLKVRESDASAVTFLHEHLAVRDWRNEP